MNKKDLEFIVAYAKMHKMRKCSVSDVLREIARQDWWDELYQMDWTPEEVRDDWMHQYQLAQENGIVEECSRIIAQEECTIWQAVGELEFIYK